MGMIEELMIEELMDEIKAERQRQYQIEDYRKKLIQVTAVESLDRGCLSFRERIIRHDQRIAETWGPKEADDDMS